MKKIISSDGTKVFIFFLVEEWFIRYNDVNNVVLSSFYIIGLEQIKKKKDPVWILDCYKISFTILYSLTLNIILKKKEYLRLNHWSILLFILRRISDSWMITWNLPKEYI